jgi:hypothetical protein
MVSGPLEAEAEESRGIFPTLPEPSFPTEKFIGVAKDKQF